MTGKELMMGMSFVEERFIVEADSQSIPKTESRAWIKWVSLTACLCLLIFGVRGLDRTEAPAAMGEPMAAATVDVKDVCQAPMEPAEAPAMGAALTTVRIDEWTGTDFMGTVVAGNALAAGTEVTVILEESEEMRGGAPYPVGSIVEVQTVSFDAETNTLYATAIALAEE